MGKIDEALLYVREKGIVRPSQLKQIGIPVNYLSRLESRGLLVKMGRGLYQLAETMIQDGETEALPPEPSTHELLTAILQELRAIRMTLERPSPTPAPQPQKQSNNVKSVFKPSIPAPATFQPWFDRHGMAIIHLPEQLKEDPSVDKLALYMGDRYKNLSPLCEKIKQTISRKKKTFSLTFSKNVDEIAASTQFCTFLYDQTLLSDYQYNPQTRTITAAVQEVAPVTQFLTGRWLERYVFRKMIDRFRLLGRPYEFLINAGVRYADGKNGEFDILFTSGKEMYWVECKAGLNGQYAKKYATIRARLGIPATHFLLVILDAGKDKMSAIKKLYGIKVANHQNLATVLEEMIKPSTKKEITTSINSGVLESD